MQTRIGADIGGVIIDSIANDGTDTDLRGDNFLAATAVPGAFEAMRQLVIRFGAENVYIISKCGPAMEAKTRIWLEAHNFYALTGFGQENLHFCRSRAQKAPIAEELKLTGFVDDRADVLIYMRGSVAQLYLFGPQAKTLEPDNSFIPVETWDEVLHSILQEAA